MMNNKVSFLTIYCLLLTTMTSLAQASPVDMPNNTSSQSPEEQIPLQQTAVFSEVVKNVAHALQLIHLLVTDVVRNG